MLFMQHFKTIKVNKYNLAAAFIAFFIFGLLLGPLFTTHEIFRIAGFLYVCILILLFIDPKGDKP